MTEPKILVLNGPNLDMLGMREPAVYGTNTLKDLERMVDGYASDLGIKADFLQSNSEGALIDAIHRAPGEYAGIVYNPGAHTHYSYALRDAVAAISVPVVEVHISDTNTREEFRHRSVIAPACVAQVKGLGFEGYCRAIDVFCENEVLERLGEGFENRYPIADNIIVGIPGNDAEAEEHLVEEAAGATEAAPAVEPQAESVAAVAAPQAEDATAFSDSADYQADFADYQAQPVEFEQAALEGVEDMPVASDGGQVEDAPVEMNDMSGLADVAAKAAPVAAVAAGAEAASQAISAGEAAEGAVVDGAVETVAEAAVVESAQSVDVDADEPIAEAAASQSVAVADSVDTDIAPSAGFLSFERQSLLNDVCKQMGIDAFIVRDTPSIEWLTAFDGVFDEERAHALLVRPTGSVLHTDSRYANALRTKAASVTSDVVVNDSRVSHARFVAEALGTVGEPYPGQLGLEDTVTYDEFVQVAQEFGMNCLVPTKDIVMGLRAVKDEGEIARLRAAQAITDAAFAHIIQFMKPGMTEREVQLELEYFMLRHGAEGVAFRSIVAAGANGADPHAVPGDTRLEAGQCVVLDFGAKAQGYCSDMTRTVFLGEPSQRMQHAWTALREANETVERALAPGMTGKQAHELAEKVLEEGGFGGTMGHGLGHGVGIEVHEQPVLNLRNEVPLVAGNVVTVEPGIYLPGEFGMRLEDFGVITDGGFDVFTQTTHELVII